MIRIVSDGTPAGTVVTSDGVEMDNVIEARWSLHSADGQARVVLTIDHCEVDVVGDDA